METLAVLTTGVVVMWAAHCVCMRGVLIVWPGGALDCCVLDSISADCQ